MGCPVRIARCVASTRAISAATPGGSDSEVGSGGLRIALLGNQVRRQDLGDPFPPRLRPEPVGADVAGRLGRRHDGDPLRRARAPADRQRGPCQRAGPSSRAAARPTAVRASAPPVGPIGPRPDPRPPGPAPTSPIPGPPDRADDCREPRPHCPARATPSPPSRSPSEAGRWPPILPQPDSARELGPLARARPCRTTTRPAGHGPPGDRRSPHDLAAASAPAG